jgi:iojap-like protein
MESLDLCKKIVSILDEKKGSDIVVLDISEISVLSDYFVIVSAENARQLEALKDALEDAVQLDNRKAEGESSSGWILLDYKDVIVHIFDKDTRSFYNLEKIWSDAKRVEC